MIRWAAAILGVLALIAILVVSSAENPGRIRGERSRPAVGAPDPPDAPDLTAEIGQALNHLRGQLLDDRGHAVAGTLWIRVLAENLGAPNEPMARFCKTDEHGWFEESKLPSGWVQVRASASGHIDAETDWVRSDADIEIRLRRSARLEVLVLDEHGNRCPDASVFDADRLLPESDHGYRGLLGRTSTNGQLLLGSLAGTSLRLVAMLGDYGSDAVTARPDADDPPQTVTLRIRSDKRMYSRISVVLTDEHGAPIPRIGVKWREPRWLPPGVRLDRDGDPVLHADPVYAPSSASSFFSDLGYTGFRTDATGTVILDVPAPPGFTVQIRTRMHSDSPYLSAVTQAVTGTTVKLVLRRGVYRTIVLRDANGEDWGWLNDPILIGPAVRSKFAGPGVRYLLDPNARYIVLGNRVPDDLGSHWSPPSTDVTTEFFEDDSWLLLVEDAPSPSEPMNLSGRIVDETGAPLAGVALRGSGLATTRPDGTFQLSMSGTDGSVRIQHPKRAVIYRAWKYGVAKWEDPVVLPKAAKLRIELRAPSGLCPVDWYLDCTAGTWPDRVQYSFVPVSRGRFEVRPSGQSSRNESAHLALLPGATGTVPSLPPGPIDVRLYTDGYEIRKRVVIGPQMQTVVFDLR